MPRKAKESNVSESKLKQAAKHLVQASKHGDRERACTMKAHEIMSGEKRGKKPKN